MKKKKKFKLSKPLLASLNFLIGSMIIALTSFIIFVSASPPGTAYAPGETLSPSCAPGDTNCAVYAPLTTSLTATTTVALNNYGLNFDSGTFYIDSLNNYIGIGTTSPYAALSVAGRGVFNQDIRADYFTATSTSATSTFPYLSVTTNSNLGTIIGGTWQGQTMGVAYGGTGLTSATAGYALIGGPTANALQATSTLFITPAGYAGIGTSSPYAKLTVWGSGTGANNLVNFVNSASSTLMTILENGSIGIGTTSPYAALSVAGRGVFDQDIRADYFTATTTTATSTFSSGFTAGSNAALIVNLAAPANSLYITSAGNLGIATATPSTAYKLDIYGNARIDGTDTATSTIRGNLNLTNQAQDHGCYFRFAATSSLICY